MSSKNKTVKEIETEAKKKTTAQAKNIVALAKAEASKSDDAKKASRKKPDNASAAKSNSLNVRGKSQRTASSNAKKPLNATVMSLGPDPNFSALVTGESSSAAVARASTKKNPLQAKEKSRDEIDRKSPGNAKKEVNATVTSFDPDPNSNDLVTGESSSAINHATVTSMDIDPNSNNSFIGQSSSTPQRLTPASNSTKSKSAVHTLKSANSGDADYNYHFEIDCKRVADSIDVKNLTRFLEQQLKVDGKKNNLDNTISIHCEGHKVVIRSRVYMPKKSLRFLSKKFLKKNWNIQVISKNSHSYEYKYVGTL